MISFDKDGLLTIDFSAAPRSAQQWEELRSCADAARSEWDRKVFAARSILQLLLAAVMGAAAWFGSTTEVVWLILPSAVLAASMLFSLLASLDWTPIFIRYDNELSRWFLQDLSPIHESTYKELVSLVDSSRDAQSYVRTILAQGREVYWPEFHAIKRRLEQDAADLDAQRRQEEGRLARQLLTQPAT